MSKILSGMLLAGLLATASQADLLRVEMGGGAWSNEISGPIQYKNLAQYNADNLGYSTETKPYLWLNVKHPIPILPNLRLEYADVSFSGNSTQPFEYDGRRFDAFTYSETTMTQIDTILYYNLLDRTAWITLDVGLDVKYMDASFKANGEATLIVGGPTFYQSVDESEKLVLPLLYTRLRVDLPLDIGIEGSAKYLKYKDSKMSDLSIKADYTLVDVLPFDVGLEVGYRFENINLNQDDFDSIDVDVDLDIKGVFAGAVVKF